MGIAEASDRLDDDEQVQAQEDENQSHWKLDPPEMSVVVTGGVATTVQAEPIVDGA